MHKKDKKIGGILLLLLATSLACAISAPATPTVDTNATATGHAIALAQTETVLEATSQALSESMTKAAATATPIPSATPIPATKTPTPTPGPIIIEDDFSENAGRWINCEKCAIADGVLYMGPYPAADSLDGYITLCSDCGYVDEYKMSVDVTYQSGASDRGFGLVLWENSGYYIDLEISTWQAYGVWYFNADATNPSDKWYFVLNKPFMSSNYLRPGRLTNHLDVEVTYTDGKRMANISINGKQVQSFEMKGGPGQVGLMVGLHSLGVSFDNFYFEGLPVYMPGSKTNDG